MNPFLSCFALTLTSAQLMLAQSEEAPAGEPVPKPTVELKAKGLSSKPLGVIDILEQYQEITGKTVLRPASLPKRSFRFIGWSPSNDTNTIAVFDKVLWLNGVTMVNVGTRFVKALPESQAFGSGPEFRIDPELKKEPKDYVTVVARVSGAKPTDVLAALTRIVHQDDELSALRASTQGTFGPFRSGLALSEVRQH